LKNISFDWIKNTQNFCFFGLNANMKLKALLCLWIVNRRLMRTIKRLLCLSATAWSTTS
jgi:hypothetical protein